MVRCASEMRTDPGERGCRQGTFQEIMGAGIPPSSRGTHPEQLPYSDSGRRGAPAVHIQREIVPSRYRERPSLCSAMMQITPCHSCRGPGSVRQAFGAPGDGRYRRRIHYHPPTPPECDVLLSECMIDLVFDSSPSRRTRTFPFCISTISGADPIALSGWGSRGEAPAPSPLNSANSGIRSSGFSARRSQQNAVCIRPGPRAARPGCPSVPAGAARWSRRSSAARCTQAAPGSRSRRPEGGAAPSRYGGCPPARLDGSLPALAVALQKIAASRQGAKLSDRIRSREDRPAAPRDLPLFSIPQSALQHEDADAVQGDVGPQEIGGHRLHGNDPSRCSCRPAAERARVGDDVQDDIAVLSSARYSSTVYTGSTRSSVLKNFTPSGATSMAFPYRISGEAGTTLLSLHPCAKQWPGTAAGGLSASGAPRPRQRVVPTPHRLAEGIFKTMRYKNTMHKIARYGCKVNFCACVNVKHFTS